MVRSFVIAAILALSVGAGTAPAQEQGTANDRGTALIHDLQAAIRGTAAFHNVAKAESAGYGEFTDAQGIACIENPGVGAMGIHYANGALVGDTELDPARPEVLVYEPRHGRLRLVALEYVVFQAAWDAENRTPPSLFGQRFSLTPSPNRYGIPAHYELHVWLWKSNPSGLFADWNPRVVC